MAVWRTLFFLGQDDWVLPAEALFYLFKSIEFISFQRSGTNSTIGRKTSTKRGLSFVDVRR
ncbi:hypothetical protein [Paenibacillus lautus]|uniref:hypothetical protein n=1 Tax=Paenibacillus lautus TaxID=1401 RepID=UPI002DBAA8BD|nr:hypothetical protein [Paenibacillus lautus]MEC0255985.1 hypothetical protein [Paenibacillus lautus]